MSRDLPTPGDATMVALVSRRLRVLARPSVGHLVAEDLPDPDRWAAVLASVADDGISPFDEIALTGTLPIDLACAAALRVLTEQPRRAGRIALDVLAAIDAERKVALYLATPKDRRGIFEDHPDFALVVGPYRDTLDAALLDLDTNADTLKTALHEGIHTGDPTAALAMVPARYRPRVLAAITEAVAS